MNRLLKITGFLILVLFVFAECSKYEEGPVISFRSREKRLFKYWQVHGIELNGSDVTTTYLDSTYAYKYWWIQRNSVGQLESFCHGNQEYGQRFFFSIEDDFEKIRINNVLTDIPGSDPDYMGFEYGPIGLINVDWRIIKLKKKELKLRCNYLGSDYTVTLGNIE